MTEYHYTYMLTLEGSEEFYIGVRSCRCEIKDDNYMGSMVTWKPDKSKLTKKIISIYNNRETANKAERFMILLQKKYNKNILCKNAYVPNLGFCNYGYKNTEEYCKAMSEKTKGEKNGFYGKHHTEESIKKMRTPRSEEVKARMSIGQKRRFARERELKLSLISE